MQWSGTANQSRKWENTAEHMKTQHNSQSKTTPQNRKHSKINFYSKGKTPFTNYTVSYCYYLDHSLTCELMVCLVMSVLLVVLILVADEM